MSPRLAGERRFDVWFALVLLTAFGLFTYHLDWGLPHGNYSWAADAYGPITVLGLFKRSFAKWNSGFFYFKYPLGYPFLLAALYTPYLGWLRATGAWTSPASAYPYGFADPERATFVLAMIGRGLSVVFALGLVAASYGIIRRLMGTWAARLAALLVATAYPIVYYAHTTNLDIGYAFWSVLALYAALVASRSPSRLPWAALGIAAAMALSTKEQCFAFLLPLPFLAIGTKVREGEGWRECLRPTVLAMVGAGIATLLLANNVAYNPLGFVGRIAYLLGRPLEAVSVRLAPVEFAFWKGGKEWTYVKQLWDALDSGLGTPLACLAAVGAVAAIFRAPRAALWLLVPAASYYYLSLRGLDLITLRYTLPIMVVAALLGGMFLAQLRKATPRGGPGWAVLALTLLIAGLGLARAVELEWLLRNDPRYAAEEWMASNLPAGARGEIYQKPVYLPRFDRWPVEAVALASRSVEEVGRRAPDFIVLSSASAKSISHRWNPDWRTTRDLLAPDADAVRLVDALRSGDLGYRVAARFQRSPLLLRSRITSINPEISIYVRESDFDERRAGRAGG